MVNLAPEFNQQAVALSKWPRAGEHHARDPALRGGGGVWLCRGKQGLALLHRQAGAKLWGCEGRVWCGREGPNGNSTVCVGSSGKEAGSCRERPR